MYIKAELYNNAFVLLYLNITFLSDLLNLYLTCYYFKPLLSHLLASWALLIVSGVDIY